MPKKVDPFFRAWSFSRLACWEECPLKARFKYLDKLPEPEAQALKAGSDAHEAAGAYIKGETSTLAPALESFADVLSALRKDRRRVRVEAELAFREDWSPCGWFDRDCWLRVKVDATHAPTPLRRVIWDWKTGKVREKDDQLRLYLVAAFADEPKVKEAEARFGFLEHGIEWPEEGLKMKAAEAEKERKFWNARVAPMMEARIFLPRQGYYCRWCPWSRDKGGPCKL